MGSRSALIITTSAYHDTTSQRLAVARPGRRRVAAVLGDPAIGGFQVTSITDSTNQQWKVGVDEYLDKRVFDDLLVLYISGHGVRTRAAGCISWRQTPSTPAWPQPGSRPCGCWTA